MKIEIERHTKESVGEFTASIVSPRVLGFEYNRLDRAS